LIIFIGKTISENLRLSGGDRVIFLFDDQDNRKWMIKKSLENIGYKLVKTANSAYLRLQITLKIPDFSVLEKDLRTRSVPCELIEGGLLIDAS
jgi:hypothetical protein